MPYKVLVDDNFQCMDASERYELGQFPTLAEAEAACCRIVDRFLIAEFKPGMTSQTLYESYTAFGDDPFIVAVAPEQTTSGFSAWAYARRRCEAMCSPGSSPVSDG